jgi:hypothetical protein
MLRRLVGTIVLVGLATASPSLYADLPRGGPLQPPANRGGGAQPRAAAHPEGTALALAALLRYANNTPDGSFFDKQVALRLDKIPNARAIAKRLVQRYENLPTATRNVHFPGVTGADNLKTRAFDVGSYRNVAARAAAGSLAAVPSNVDTLPPESPTPSLSALEIDYAGFVCNKSADAAGDKVAVYTNWIGHPKKTDPYTTAVKKLPASGSISGATTGSASTANAGPIYSSATTLGVTSSDAGAVLVSSVLMDDGTLDAQTGDLEVLIGLAQTFASTVLGDDRMTPLKTGIDFTMGTLHLSNPEKWSTKAVQARLISITDLKDWAVQDAKNTSGIHWRFDEKHDARGSDYQLFFNAPGAAPQLKNVSVTIQSLTALGSVKDTENGSADLGAEVSVGGVSKAREFAKDHNSVTPGWTVQRGMVMAANKKVHVTLTVYEKDAAPDFAVNTGGWGSCSMCGDWDKAKAFTGVCFYAGGCTPIFNNVDVNPKPDVGSGGWGSYQVRTVDVDVNLTTGAITGDAVGTKGNLITVTGDNPERKASIAFKIDF